MSDSATLFDLTDRIVVLTGAAGYLGAAMTKGLVDAGARVLMVDLNRARLDAVAAATSGRGSTETFPLDLTDAGQVDDFVAMVRDRYGRLDVLINNAYAGPSGAFATSTDRDYRDSYEMAVVASTRLIRTAQDLLEEAARRHPGGASVINMASMYGVVSPDFRVYDHPDKYNPVAYGAAKAAVVQMSRYLACQLAPLRIRVNAMSPGPFPAPGVQENDPAFCARLADRVPLGRIGRPEDLVGSILFLASDASAYVTGINLMVDGGWTAW